MKVSNRRPYHRPLGLLAVMLATSLAILWVTESVPAQTTGKQPPAKQPPGQKIPGKAPEKLPPDKLIPSQKPALTHNDYNIWRTIQTPLISPDGKFAAYTVTPQDGDSELVVCELKKDSDVVFRHNRGRQGGGAGGAGGGGGGKGGAAPEVAGGAKVAFTDDGKRLIFTIAPSKGGLAKKKADVKEEKKQEKKEEKDKGKDKDKVKDQEKEKPVVQPSIGIMELPSGKVTIIPGARSFILPETFSGGMVVQMVYQKATGASGEKQGDPDDDEGDEEEEEGAFDFLQAKGKKGGGQKQGAAPVQVTPSDVIIYRFADGMESPIPDVTDYTLTRDGGLLVCVVVPKDAEKAGVYAFDTSSPAKELVSMALVKGKARYSRMTWDEKQRQLAFFADYGASPKDAGPVSLFLWDRDSGGKKVTPPLPAVELISSKNSAGLKDGCVLTNRGTIKFSDDSSRITVAVAPPLPPAEKDIPKAGKDNKVIVELWHWNDEFIQPMQKARNQKDKQHVFPAVFNVKAKKLVQIADKTMPDATVSNAGTYALGHTDRPYRQLVGFDTEYSDYFLVNTNDGSRKPLLKKHHGPVTFSPSGKYAAFYDGRDWNTLTVGSGSLTNITKNIKEAKFFNEDYDSPSQPPAYGICGWSRDESNLLLYDKSDIWEVSVRGGSHSNLTFGTAKEENAQLRYIKLDPKEKTIDTNKPMLLRVEYFRTRATGFVQLDPRQKPVPLLVRPFSFGIPIKAKAAGKLLFTAQKFEHFPDLYCADMNFEEKTGFQVSNVNPETEKFNWGTANIVPYTSTDGVPLSGILIIPENFDPKVKYPMIVHIYERLSQNLHHFVAPKEGTSINATYYASNGYLVFMPDIAYTVGYPGQSALKCVLPGIQAVVNTGMVNEDAIGIQGHSWGGYQIAYMITQTGRFKAAAAGAAVSNMTSAYDGIRWGTGLPRQFQYEKTQSRIGGSLWEYPMRFVENSPIFMADRVKTPLLLLHNDQDDAVPWYQGIEYYLALRRLGKEVYMFNYVGEPHGLKKKENQKDYTIRMQQFFDHLLRGMDAPDWMRYGIPYTPRGPVKGPEIGGMPD